MANKKITELMAGTPTRDSLLESATDVGGTMVSRKFKVGAVADVNNVQIASEYDDTATYAYGDYCIKNGVLYRCTTAISVAEAWTSAHWTAVMVTGEYKRVRIMTKAQFDLLSNDEKDGFIYVSDYPTKIQDIDNVSLTTSDNNKLLGVSVSGSDISVGAFGGTSETKSCEISLGTGSSLNCFMQTYGKVVVLNLVGYLTSSATITTSDNLFTGLPVINGGNEIYSISQKGRFRLYNGAGEAIIRLYDISATSNYVGNVFVYITQ